MTDEKTEPKAETRAGGEDARNNKLIRWDALATALGYNQLAKEADTLGEKVFCRMARDAWEDEYEKLGGVLRIARKQEVAGELLLTLRERPPHIFFRKGDIELMRAAVAAFDAKNEVSSDVGGQGGSTHAKTW